LEKILVGPNTTEHKKQCLIKGKNTKPVLVVANIYKPVLAFAITIDDRKKQIYP
jgi:hypothetical protein